MGVRIVVAEDSLLVREGIEKLLGAQPGIEIVAVCVDLPELLAAVEEHEPDCFPPSCSTCSSRSPMGA